MAIPLKDSLLVPYMNNFTTRIQAAPATFGLVAAQAAEMYSRKQAYVTAYEALMNARADGTRSQSQTADKNTKKAWALEYCRELYGFVSSNKSVSDANKILLGVHVRDTTPTPVPPPAARPTMGIVSVVGRTVTASIRTGADASSRRKPAGTIGAYVYSFVGEEYPSDPTLWLFEGAATKSTYPITFADSVPAGARVWVCAAWVNRKGETGPVGVPVPTNLQYTGATTGTAELKIAA